MSFIEHFFLLLSLQFLSFYQFISFYKTKKLLLRHRIIYPATIPDSIGRQISNPLIVVDQAEIHYFWKILGSAQ